MTTMPMPKLKPSLGWGHTPELGTALSLGYPGVGLRVVASFGRPRMSLEAVPG